MWCLTDFSYVVKAYIAQMSPNFMFVLNSKAVELLAEYSIYRQDKRYVDIYI